MDSPLGYEHDEVVSPNELVPLLCSFTLSLFPPSLHIVFPPTTNIFVFITNMLLQHALHHCPSIFEVFPAREKPILTQDDDDQSSDNEDFCFACAGSGFLVCCDECDKAFHFTCFDPPLDQDSELLENAFLCKVCKKDKYKPAKETTLFGPLHEILNNRNPTAFRLPPEVKFFFEDVREGPEGEYEEVNVQRTT